MSSEITAQDERSERGGRTKSERGGKNRKNDTKGKPNKVLSLP